MKLVAAYTPASLISDDFDLRVVERDQKAVAKVAIESEMARFQHEYNNLR